MRRLFSNKIFISIVIVAIFSFGLVGCLDIVIPPPENTGTLQIKINNDLWTYNVYTDGNDSSGIYLGITDDSGVGIFHNISIGYHSFYVISTDGYYEGWGYKTIETGYNLVEIITYSTAKVKVRNKRTQ